MLTIDAGSKLLRRPAPAAEPEPPRSGLCGAAPCAIPRELIGSALITGRFSAWLIVFAVAADPAPSSAPAADSDAGGVEAGPAITVPPTVGLRFAGDTARFTLALPWSVQFGPLLKGDAGSGLRPYRALLEPGLILPAGGSYTSYYFRAGLRAIFSSAGALGLGLGAGYTQSLSNNLKSAISQEMIVTVGRCCSPGSLLFSVRYEYALAGGGEVWTSIGLPLW
jgi:hypothetical protein